MGMIVVRFVIAGTVAVVAGQAGNAAQIPEAEPHGDKGDDAARGMKKGRPRGTRINVSCDRGRAALSQSRRPGPDAADHHEGPRPKAEIVELAREQGLSPNMLLRVTRELKVISEKHTMGGKATWSLPEAMDGAQNEKVLTIGESPSRLDDLRGISNREGAAAGRRD